MLFPDQAPHLAGIVVAIDYRSTLMESWPRVLIKHWIVPTKIDLVLRIRDEPASDVVIPDEFAAIFDEVDLDSVVSVSRTPPAPGHGSAVKVVSDSLLLIGIGLGQRCFRVGRLDRLLRRCVLGLQVGILGCDLLRVLLRHGHSRASCSNRINGTGIALGNAFLNLIEV